MESKVTADKREKATRFAAILSQLRKEKGYSQKKAAADLGISQALLSHYEKGIRECGLDFVIRCSEYYGVSTDYLLGVSDVRHGMNEEYFSKISGEIQSEEAMKSLSQGMKILVDAAIKTDNKRHSFNYLHDCYLLSLYSIALTLAKVGALPKDMFMLDYNVGHELAAAATTVLHSRFAMNEYRGGEEIMNLESETLQMIVKGAEKYLMENYIFE